VVRAHRQGLHAPSRRVTQLGELLAETSRVRLQWPGHPDTEQVGHCDRLLLLEDLEEEALITQAGLCRASAVLITPELGKPRSLVGYSA
jgi:hypothetical protein